ncbi:MAG: cupredoxin domain-containing protein [Acidimicrobiia bacterium]
MRRLAGTSTVLVLLLVACGGGGGGGNGNAAVEAGAREIKVNSRSYAFAPMDIDVQAGEDIAVVLHSQDQAHDFTIEDKGLVVAVDGGKTAKGGFRLTKSGTYTFYCSISGHRAAGMEGTITAS